VNNSPGDIKKILLVQLYSNGDCLYATAVARQIKNDYPECQLTWAIAGFCKDIIAHNPHVDAVRIVNDVPKNHVAAFRKFKETVLAEKAQGLWNEVFITSNADTNLALYDGTIRGMILRAYQRPLTVSLQPELILSEAEKNNVEQFAARHDLASFKHVLLWEYAPQSGQTDLSFELVMNISKRITEDETVCIILSSANPFIGSKRIIDASSLSIRENAGITHHCTLLIGCSSGITWLTTSTAAKFLPMLQLLNADAAFINTPSTDFNRFDIRHNGLVEMFNYDKQKIIECITVIINEGIEKAASFHQHAPLQFKTTKKIVYNLLVYREFTAIKRHYAIMKEQFGLRPALLSAFYGAFITFPFKLANNLISKRLLKKK